MYAYFNYITVDMVYLASVTLDIKNIVNRINNMYNDEVKESIGKIL